MLLHLNAYWFGLAYLWNGLHTILLPAILLGMVPAGLKNTYLGGLTFLGLTLATVTQPVGGAVSDRSGWLGAYGRRRPWIALGTAASLLFLALLAQATTIWLLAVTYMGLQVFASLAEAAFQSLLPDRVPLEQRGRGAGYKNVLQTAGFVVGVGLAGMLADRGRIGWALIATGAVLAATAAWTCLGVQEPAVAPAHRPSLNIGEALRVLLAHSFRLDRSAAPGYGRLLVGRALLMAGYFALQGFAQYYVADELHMANPAGATALLMAVMGTMLLVLAIPTGALADRVGRKPLNVLAGLLGALATLSLLAVGNVAQLVMAGGLVGVSVSMFLSVNWAWAADLVPPEEAGRYLGLGNLAVAGAGALSRLVSGPIVDLGNALQAGLGYHVLFVVLALSMLLGTWLLAGVPETQPTAKDLLRAILPGGQRK